MKTIKTAADLVALQQSLAATCDPDKVRVTVCGGTGCRTSGSEKVIDAFRQALVAQGLDATVDVMVTGCHGFCERGPVVVIKPQGVFYERVKLEDVPELVSETLVHRRVVDRLLYSDPLTGRKITYEHEVPFYQLQTRVVLDQNGLVDPTSISDYLALGGYGSLSKVLHHLAPVEDEGRAGEREKRNRTDGGREHRQPDRPPGECPVPDEVPLRRLFLPRKVHPDRRHPDQVGDDGRHIQRPKCRVCDHESWPDVRWVSLTSAVP